MADILSQHIQHTFPITFVSCPLLEEEAGKRISQPLLKLVGMWHHWGEGDKGSQPPLPERPHKEKAFLHFLPFQLFILPSSLDLKGDAATLCPLSDEHDVKRPPTKEGKQKGKSAAVWQLCWAAVLPPCAHLQTSYETNLALICSYHFYVFYTVQQNTSLTKILTQGYLTLFSSYFLLGAKCLSCQGLD